jgi:uncharacterized protein (DUF433 family)
MNSLDLSQKVPLAADSEGVIRVTESRVSLDSIVHQFKNGATAEQIQEDFPSVNLADIYAVIAYYLQHSKKVDDYLAQQTQAAAQTREVLESKTGIAGLRETLKRRRAQMNP